ncbi:MAG: DNA repair protein RecN [Prevotella sp.]|nr:DNA repair protein RecN [Prevotella sp.]
MLTHLYIRNFTLIDELDMEFHAGFSVITGETGAGKSIILGAIGLLLGQRADMKSIKQGAEKCVVEAHFNLSSYSDTNTFFSENDIDGDPDDTIVRRELTASGKSRAFINDSPVGLNVLKELGERLIDVHSQHQNLLLAKHDFLLSVVDVIAADQKELSDYQTTFHAYRQTQKKLDELTEQIAANRQNADFMQFQYDELSNAHLSEGEQEELEARCDTMTHAEDIKKALFEAGNALSSDGSGAVTLTRQAAQALHSIEKVFPDAKELAERLDSTYIELKDVAGEVEDRMEQVDFDPSELDTINSRLDRLYDLQKKYRVQTVEKLMEIRDELGQKLSSIENSDEQMALLEKEAGKLLDECRAKARVLTLKRQAAAKAIEKEMGQRLSLLAMPNARIVVAVEGNEFTANGYDRVNFLFSANTSSPLQPISQVASGGEIARVMLSLKAMISGAVKLPTIIFDEIDTGVSGKIAEQMARIMAEMGREGRQVISITHLPQIAALGTTHYRVYKEETPNGTTSHMQMLSPEERVNEVAQMLSGTDITAAAIENARQLLKS